jgi:hypothetical protein
MTLGQTEIYLQNFMNWLIGSEVSMDASRASMHRGIADHRHIIKYPIIEHYVVWTTDTVVK